MFRLPSSWPPARVEGGVRAAGLDTTSAASAASAGSVDEFQISHFRCFLQYLRARDLPPRLKIYQTAAEVPKKIKNIYQTPDLPPRRPLFEGVCLTTVILTPGACGGRLRAAAHDIDSAAPAAPAAPPECSENADLAVFYST